MEGQISRYDKSKSIADNGTVRSLKKMLIYILKGRHGRNTRSEHYNT